MPRTILGTLRADRTQANIFCRHRIAEHMPDHPPTTPASFHGESPKTKRNFASSLVSGLPTLLVLAAMGGAWMVMHHINSGGSRTEEVAEVAEEPSSNDNMVLSEGKLNAGNFKSIAAQPQIVQHVHTVPGRLRYDQTKHVDVKAPIDGILAELVVMPGDHVAAGDLIAVVRSPEIGQARAEVLKRQKERDIAQQILNRELTLKNNLEQVFKMLDQNQSVDAIADEFANQDLAAYRQDILSAYSKWKLANDLVENVRPLVSSGAVAGRTIRERESQRQLEAAAFRTACDQAKFAADQAKLKAEANVAEADRQLNLAWQSLETLLGYRENKETVNLSSEDALSRLEVRAPFAGSIESREFAMNERVMRGDSLVVLANTDSLTVEASIRESDWSTVGLLEGSEVSVVVPALGDRVFPAKVRYFGREVQADTNSVPLVANIENGEDMLRPGMFVRVTVPIGKPRQALSIKPESVVQHGNQKFVFVDMNNGVFKRVDISTGQATDDWIEITDGLSPGQLVVTNGAFLLKSEMLLAGEGE